MTNAVYHADSKYAWSFWRFCLFWFFSIFRKYLILPQNQHFIICLAHKTSDFNEIDINSAVFDADSKNIFLNFFEFLFENFIFFRKIEKIQKPKIFKNLMHIWNQHEKLHWSCYLHQNRTNLAQLRKSTLKVKKWKKKSKEKSPQIESNFWNPRQKLLQRRNFHLEGRRSNVTLCTIILPRVFEVNLNYTNLDAWQV